MDPIALHLGDLALVWLAFALAIASPGPSNLAVVSTSMAEGRGRGCALALGVATGSATWGVLTALGITALITSTPSALTAIKLTGAAYMLFLAYRAGHAALDKTDPALARSGVTSTLAGSYLRGVLIHLTNPKALLTWMAILAIGIKADMQPAVVVAMVLGCLCMSVLVNTSYALAFSTDVMVRGYRRARRPVQAALALFFVAAAYKLATLV